MIQGTVAIIVAPGADKYITKQRARSLANHAELVAIRISSAGYKRVYAWINDFCGNFYIRYWANRWNTLS